LTTAQIGGLLARGSTCEVFDLADPAASPPGRRLVLKRILPSAGGDEGFRQRLQGLSELLIKFRHPYAEEVIEVHASTQERCYLICERLEGESLASLLQREGRLPLLLVRQLARQIAEALSAAHAQGIVHGNLSPRRILLTRAGRPESASNLRVKVRGFGLAPPLGMGLYGTPSYLSPEQLRDFEPRLAASPRSDQFALAALLFRALEGRPLYCGERVEDVRARIVREDPKHFELLGVSSAEMTRVDKALHKALSKDPNSRFERLLDFIEALEPKQQASVIRQLVPMAAPTMGTPPPRGPSSAGEAVPPGGDADTLPLIRLPHPVRPPAGRQGTLSPIPAPPSPRTAILFLSAAGLLAMATAFAILAMGRRIRELPPSTPQHEQRGSREATEHPSVREHSDATEAKAAGHTETGGTLPAVRSRAIPQAEALPPQREAQPPDRNGVATPARESRSGRAGSRSTTTSEGAAVTRAVSGCRPDPRFKHSGFEAWFQQCLTPSVLRSLRRTEIRVLRMRNGGVHATSEQQLPPELNECLDRSTSPSYDDIWRGWVTWTCK
jgi:hypothetical protein